MLGAVVNVPLGTNVSGFLGGRAAALWASGDLDAHQETVIDVLGLVTQNTFEVSDSADDIAFMGRAVAGLSAGAGRFTGTIFGAAEWRNDMYEVVNPAPVGATSTAPAHLDQTDMWNLSVGLKGSIKLGGAQ